MLLVFLLLDVFLFLILAFLTLQIKLSIQGEKTSCHNGKTNKEKEIKVKLSFYILGRVKIGTKQLTKEMGKKFIEKQKEMNRSLKDIKKYEPELSTFLEDMKALKIKVEKFHLKLLLGTEDVILTSSIIVFISTAISCLLPHVTEKPVKKAIVYQILPLYEEKNQYDIQTNCIIQVKLVHIIYVIYRVIKRREIDKNGKSSNRRAYEYSYEQH